MRLLLFFGCLLLLYLAGARNFVLVGLSVLVSGILSFVLLSRQRDEMSGSLVSSFRGFRRRLDQGAGAEDQD